MAKGKATETDKLYAAYLAESERLGQTALSLEDFNATQARSFEEAQIPRGLTIRLITEWVYLPGSNEMRVALEHPKAGVGYSDVTWQDDANDNILRLDVNALVVEVTNADPALLAELKADPNVVILWAHDEDTGVGDRTSRATAALRDRIETALAGRMQVKGMVTKAAAIKARSNDADTVEQLEAQVTDYLKYQPATRARARNGTT